MGVLQLSQLYNGHNILTPYETAQFEIQQQKQPNLDCNCFNRFLESWETKFLQNLKNQQNTFDCTTNAIISHLIPSQVYIGEG